MTLRPEQERALAYARRRGTEAPLADLRRRVAETFAALDARLASIPAAHARIRPAPAAWSVHEVVDHLIVSHRPAMDQLRTLLAGREPEGGPVPANLQSPEPLARGWAELVAELAAVHAGFLALLDGAADASPQEARAPIEMVVKCATPDGALEPVHWVERVDWKAFAAVIRVHALEHLHQIERTLAAGGEPPAR